MEADNPSRASHLDCHTTTQTDGEDDEMREIRQALAGVNIQAPPPSPEPSPEASLGHALDGVSPKPLFEHLPAPQPMVEHLPAPQPMVEHLPAPQPMVEHLPAPQPLVEHLPAPQLHHELSIYDRIVTNKESILLVGECYPCTLTMALAVQRGSFKGICSTSKEPIKKWTKKDYIDPTAKALERAKQHASMSVACSSFSSTATDFLH
jgi:hypothetical protein